MNKIICIENWNSERIQTKAFNNRNEFITCINHIETQPYLMLDKIIYKNKTVFKILQRDDFGFEDWWISKTAPMYIKNYIKHREIENYGKN